MNNKAFTVVELLASFTLTMIIVVFLFEIVLELKDVYTSDALKTKVLSQNALIATTLNQKLDDKSKPISTISCLNNSQCNVLYYDGFEEEIMIDGNKVKIGNQIFSMPENTEITVDDEKYQFKSESYNEDALLPDNNSYYIKIAYTVKSAYLKEPIKFSYVYTYNS